jgi:hypothetical protein
MFALATACTAPAQTAPASTAPSNLATATASAPSGTPTAIPGYVEAREGVDYEVLFDVPNPRADGKTDVVLTVTPDGRALVGRSKSAIPLNQDEILVKTSQRERTLPQVLDGAPRQAIAAVANDTDMVWLETSSTSLVEADWNLFTADSRGRAHHLASSDDYGGDTAPPPPDYTPLALDDTHAYLTVAVPLEQRGHHSVILAVPLDGSPSTVLLEDARLPAVGTDGIHFVRSFDIRTANVATTPPPA